MASVPTLNIDKQIEALKKQFPALFPECFTPTFHTLSLEDGKVQVSTLLDGRNGKVTTANINDALDLSLTLARQHGVDGWYVYCETCLACEELLREMGEPLKTNEELFAQILTGKNLDTNQSSAQTMAFSHNRWATLRDRAINLEQKPTVFDVPFNAF